MFIILIFGVFVAGFAHAGQTCKPSYHNIWSTTVNLCITKNPSYEGDSESCSALYGAGGVIASGFGYSVTIYNNCEKSAESDSIYVTEVGYQSYWSYFDKDKTPVNTNTECSKNFTALIGCNKKVSELTYKSKSYHDESNGIHLFVAYDSYCVEDVNANISIMNLCDMINNKIESSYSSSSDIFTCGNIRTAKRCTNVKKSKHTDVYYHSSKQKVKEITKQIRHEDL
ncbi:ER-localized apoptosis regulator [Hypsugopox virus]|nr:ER-localized apoptosis regulator [Hypsugopox virus]